MELSKRKYKKNEVEELLKEQAESFANSFQEQKNRINDLVEENELLSLKLESYKQNEKKALKVLKDAEDKAEEIIKSAFDKYKLETERIKTFVVRFDGYFKYLYDKYPLYPEIQKTKEAVEKLYKMLGDAYGQNFVDGADGVIDNENRFSKTEKSQTVAVSTNGFDLNEVLNPGELDLENLCKELGLIEEE